MIKFLREFQLFILILVVIVFTFILSMRYDDTRTFPLTFCAGGLFVIMLCWKYPDPMEVDDEIVVSCGQDIKNIKRHLDIMNKPGNDLEKVKMHPDRWKLGKKN